MSRIPPEFPDRDYLGLSVAANVLVREEPEEEEEDDEEEDDDNDKEDDDEGYSE